MPINTGRVGKNFMIANPVEPRISRTPSNYKTGRIGLTVKGEDICYGLNRRLRPFKSAKFSTSSLFLTGVTKDSTGTPLGSCVVQLFTTADERFIKETTSDSVTGAYSFDILVTGPFFIVAYKAGSPDVAGTTINTLLGA
jgi:hypothetical protein